MAQLKEWNQALGQWVIVGTAAQGPQGAQGSQGAIGAQGAVGPGFRPRGAWAAATAYPVNDVFTTAGTTRRVLTAYTSGATYGATDTTNTELWAASGAQGFQGTQGAQGSQGSQGNNGTGGVGGPQGAAGATGARGAAGAAGSAEIAAMSFSTVTACTTTDTAVSGWQVVVPANSGPVDIGVPSGLLIALVTGTLANSATLYVEARIKDEAGTVMSFAKFALYPTGAGVLQTWVTTLALDAPMIANNAAAKTYSVWLRCNTVASSATVTMHTSASGFTDPVLRAVGR